MGGTRSEIYESKQLSSKLYEGKHDYSKTVISKSDSGRHKVTTSYNMATPHAPIAIL